MVEINPEKVIIARKLSVLEYEAHQLGLSQKETLEHFKKTGADWKTILESHERQLESLQALHEGLPQSEVVTGFQLNRDLVQGLQAVVALGGDDHYQYVSHFLDNQFLIPINSDTQKSDGALADFIVPSFLEFLPRLQSGDFDTEKWIRLQVSINDQPIRELGISQVFIGASDSEDMSRYLLDYRGKSETQKSSGLIIATGTGSTGWYDAAVRFLEPEGNKFSRTEEKAAFVAREPFNGKFSSLSLVAGDLGAGEKLTLTSLMNKPGRVGIDALIRKDFPRGTKVTVEISDSPLSILRKDLI